MQSRLPAASVVLVGGSSSVGKTTLAQALATRVHGDRLSVDDLRRSVDDARVRFFSETEDPWRLDPPTLCLVLRRAAEAMRPLLGRVVETALADGRGLVLEGEALDPRLAARYSSDPRVPALFVIELDSERLMQTFHRRSPSLGRLPPAERATVARTCVLYAGWLKREGQRRGLPCLPSQPWATLTDRAIGIIEQDCSRRWLLHKAI